MPNRKKTIKNNNGSQAASATGSYFYLSFVCFIMALTLVWVMLSKSDLLVSCGLTGKFYFVLLIPLGIASATTLFGILQSFARYRGRQFGGTLELGGPVVTFFLVLILGFYLTPNSGNFSLTVFVHGEGGLQDLPVRGTGNVMIDLGGDRRREPVGDKGQAIFSEIPASFAGRTVNVSLDAVGYELVDPKQIYKLQGQALYLSIRKKAACIRGRVQEDTASFPLADVKITAAGIATRTDEHGEFELVVPGDRFQKEIPVLADCEGFTPWRGNVVSDSNDTVIVLERSKVASKRGYARRAYR